MTPLLYQVDAFTSAPFSGNPAAVCVLPSPNGDAAPNAEWMQNVAAEMNLSETAFLQPHSPATYRLRWFTPTHEVDLCGHATLASAHVLWADGFLASDAPATFETASGRLEARREGTWIEMDFPADPVTPAKTPSALIDGLEGTTPAEVQRSERDLLVRLSSAQAVRGLDPKLSALATLEDTRGVIVTALSDTDDADFVSRFFAPAVGVPEDPVTGSSHCALGPYWAAETGRTSLVGRQVSNRGGTVGVEIAGPSAERLTLAGRATSVFRGRLAADPT